MPYASTFGKKVYPYQSEELPPEEQSGVPMLTNIPKSAEAAAGRGQDVYFLSDRPETEQFLAERMPATPYKQVLRSAQGKPFVDEDQLMDAVQKGKKFLGFNPMEPPNPGQVAQEAYQKYFDRVPKDQYENWPDNIKQMHIKAAQAEEKKAYDRAVKDIANAHQYLTSHASEWEKQKKEIRAAQEPSKEPMLPVIEGGKRVWRPRSQVSGREIPEGMKETIDAEGNIIYTPSTQAVGKTAPPKGGGKTEEDKEKADRQKAITMAQREPDWRLGNEKTNSWLVEKNLAVLQDREPPEPPEEVLESREIRKGTKIDLKNKEHMAVLKRLRREADAKATKEGKIDTDKARKILNQKIEEKGWILPMGINLKVK